MGVAPGHDVVRLLNLWDTLRGSFWFVPALFTVLAIGLAAGLLTLDQRLGQQPLGGWLYSGGAEGARSLLSALVGSIMTVIGLAFSIMIVTLQLASAQLGPRLLRSFVRDPGNQVVLGTFVATFVYALVVLRTVRGQDGRAEAFVPHTAVTGAVVLALLSAALLIYFIHHASRSIQADHVIATVARELDVSIDRLFPERLGQPQACQDPRRAPPPAEGSPVRAPRSGYVVSVDGEALLGVAQAAGAVLWLIHRPGDFVIAGEALARITPPDRGDDTVSEAITRAFVIGAERTLVQDALFGVEQLVEIAIRALASDHIDPHTARRCIDRLGAAVARVAGRRLPGPYRQDSTGVVRVVAPTLTADDFVRTAFAAIRIHGEGSLDTGVHLLQTFARVAALDTHGALHAALLDEAARVRATAVSLREPADRERLSRAFEHVVAVVAARRRAPRPVPAPDDGAGTWRAPRALSSSGAEP
jgi:uncharacterized membrane protein